MTADFSEEGNYDSLIYCAIWLTEDKVQLSGLVSLKLQDNQFITPKRRHRPRGFKCY